MTRNHSLPLVARPLVATLLAALALMSFLAVAAVPSRAAQPAQLAQVTPPPPPNAPKVTEPDPNEIAEWFVSPAGKALGPHTIGELTRMAAERKIDAKTPVWKEGMTDWVLLRDVPELQPVVAAAPKSDEPNPPPPLNTQELLDKAMLDYLVGTWRFEGNIDQGGYRYYLVVEITYRRDGSYAGREMFQLPSQGGQVPPFINERLGTFEVTAIDERNFVLTIHERNGQSLKSSLYIVDQTTLENSVDRSKRSYRIR